MKLEGSIRIHDKATQQLMFKYLGFTEEQAKEQFGFLMDAFQFGAPPHGGLALDWIGCYSWRDRKPYVTLSLSKNNSGRDVMMLHRQLMNRS
jgi:aspartyl-tRNA synthetase